MLDDILESFLGGPDRQLRRLVEQGERLPARITAIRVVSRSERADEWSYGLDVRGPAGEFRIAVRQTLVAHPEQARLGTEVVLIHHEGRAAIDWPATLEQRGLATKPVASIFTSTGPVVPSEANAKNTISAALVTSRPLAMTRPRSSAKPAVILAYESSVVEPGSGGG